MDNIIKFPTSILLHGTCPVCNNKINYSIYDHPLHRNETIECLKCNAILDTTNYNEGGEVC